MMSVDDADGMPMGYSIRLAGWLGLLVLELERPKRLFGETASAHHSDHSDHKPFPPPHLVQCAAGLNITRKKGSRSREEQGRAGQARAKQGQSSIDHHHPTRHMVGLG